MYTIMKRFENEESDREECKEAPMYAARWEERDETIMIPDPDCLVSSLHTSTRLPLLVHENEALHGIVRTFSKEKKTPIVASPSRYSHYNDRISELEHTLEMQRRENKTLVQEIKRLEKACLSLSNSRENYPAVIERLNTDFAAEREALRRAREKCVVGEQQVRRLVLKCLELEKRVSLNVQSHEDKRKLDKNSGSQAKTDDKSRKRSLFKEPHLPCIDEDEEVHLRRTLKRQHREITTLTAQLLLQQEYLASFAQGKKFLMQIAGGEIPVSSTNRLQVARNSVASTHTPPSASTSPTCRQSTSWQPSNTSNQQTNAKKQTALKAKQDDGDSTKKGEKIKRIEIQQMTKRSRDKMKEQIGKHKLIAQVASAHLETTSKLTTNAKKNESDFSALKATEPVAGLDKIGSKIPSVSRNSGFVRHTSIQGTKIPVRLSSLPNGMKISTSQLRGFQKVQQLAKPTSVLEMGGMASTSTPISNPAGFPKADYSLQQSRKAVSKAKSPTTVYAPLSSLKAIMSIGQSPETKQVGAEVTEQAASRRSIPFEDIEVPEDEDYTDDYEDETEIKDEKLNLTGNLPVVTSVNDTELDSNACLSCYEQETYENENVKQVLDEEKVPEEVVQDETKEQNDNMQQYVKQNEDTVLQESVYDAMEFATEDFE